MDLSQFSELHVSEGYEAADSDSRDRLSELPDSLILAILSLLPMKDVVATTLLSKRWQNLWTTVPCLDFFGGTNKLVEFRSFVCGALALWKGVKILKFSIGFLFHASFTSDLDSWLLFVIEKQVEELYLDLMHQYHLICQYLAPQRLYSCPSIKKLSLICCALEISESVKWNQLKNLTIQTTHPSSEDAMNYVLAGSPQLEVLELCTQLSEKNLNIQSNSLKMLKIRIDSGEMKPMLRIWAPNLETLEFSGTPRYSCLLNVPSLTTAVLDFCNGGYGSDELVRQVILSISHVEKITLSNWCSQVLVEMMKEKDVRIHFSNAKYLKFEAAAANEIFGVLEMFPNLIVLTVALYRIKLATYLMIYERQAPHFITTVGDETIFPNPSMLHLRRVTITWYLLDDLILQLVKLILRNAHLLEKFVFRTYWDVASPEVVNFAEKSFVSIPKSSPTAEFIIVKLFAYS
ncbi:F-box/LRR-repeat protein At3g26922-like [Salvia miltiorrhiza]|uniref:F-box/LRR-repeat protein At3g26922-like n=1 Tax=Salvia miltiorrhiza TaxID=226208 RepID=UPI0025AD265D|nr:F-box/LRR-repeat protein At3g26922-like [Salvia miltiorrhiza]